MKLSMNKLCEKYLGYPMRFCPGNKIQQTNS